MSTESVFNAYHFVPPEAKHRDFAARLIEAMDDAGLVAPRARAHADPTALSKIAGVSYDVARRYLAGLTRPGKPKIERIATRLRVSPSWLEYGEGEKRPQKIVRGQADLDLMQHCVESIEQALEQIDQELDARQRSRLIVFVYRQSELMGRALTAEEVIDIMEFFQEMLRAERGV